MLVVTRVVEFGWTPAQTAEGVGVSRATVYKWLRRFREQGQAGLPGSEPPDPAVLHACSTVYGVLRRNSLSRLSDLDRTTREVIR